MNEKDNLKKIINIFLEKWDNSDNVWNNNFIQDLELNYRGYELNIAFGKGKRLILPKYPYITFLKDGQMTNKGVYPFISYLYDKNKLETGLGISRENQPEISQDITNQIENYKSTIFESKQIDSLIGKLNENIDNFEKILHKEDVKNIYTMEDKNMKTKNIMLYGAPGVGKTHNYKRLITMIEEGNNEKTIFDTISKNEITNDFDNSIFEDIKKEKRIEFVTFHQSYSYEDFIEGFRPNEDGNIELDKKGGIFKRISDKAKENLIDSEKEAIEIKQENDLLISFENYTEYKILNDEPVSLKKGDEFKFTKFENKRLYFQTTEKSNYFKEFTLFYDDFKIIYNSKLPKKTLKDISIILNTNSVQQRYAYLLAIYNDYKEKEKSISVSNELEQKIEQKNFYIVIDEINRGNISKIFGELITLIEEDKRDTYEVTLPYSKEKFKIPSNLYIIATMNSTDKSIATIDIALRRRFTFLKMKPNLDLVPEIAKELFEKINEHISKTINEDYKLGHSYFMKIENEDDLEFVKKYKIKPLLEEYFYGDEENYKKAISILNIKEDK